MYQIGPVTMYHGWGKDVLPLLESDSVDSIVTDPPYGLSKEPDMREVLTHWLKGDDYTHTGGGFMGKTWDSFVPGPATWAELYRVLKPGGHALVFAGSRTVDLMAVSMRLAGFEIRDQIQWIYGSGFPKSLDVSKAIDKAAGVEREVVGTMSTNTGMQGGNFANGGSRGTVDITAPATDAAKQWNGWGTALKPAHEPIIVARKPLVGTVAANVLRFGTGALNIDGCRVGWPDDKVPEIGTPGWGGPAKKLTVVPGQDGETVERSAPSQLGRFPANLIHDGSDEVLACFPDAPGQQGDVRGTEQSRTGGEGTNCYGEYDRVPFTKRVELDKSAARFFYQAKASKADRNFGCERTPSWENVDLDQEILSVLSLLKDTFEAITPLLVGSVCNTMSYGNSITGRFLKGSTCIISTMIKLITESKISNFSQSSHTRGIILDATRTVMASGLSPAESAEFISLLTPSITDERMELALGVVVAALQMLQPISERARLGNVHSTVKPRALMRYLCRLVTPPGGIVLDSFAGSGSTGLAAMDEGFRCILIEQDAEHFNTACARVGMAIMEAAAC